MTSKISLSLASTIFLAAAAVSSGARAEPALHPVPLNPDYAAGKNLTELPSWPAKMMAKKIDRNSYASWYVGPELTSMVASTSYGILRFTDLPYDEHVHLLNGSAVLRSKDGHVQYFKKGDTFVVPKGWTGTWELKDGYREEITMYTTSINEAMKSWFGN